ncbi:MAG: O-antigen ligase family protein [Myxococcaceae bacterium]|nr:O-antigen ligase family protein [Myxococcaceae bacterium]
MRRHALPAVAALALVVAGPQASRFEAIHAPRVVLLLALAAGLMWRGRMARAAFGAVEWLAVACLAAMAVSAALSTSPTYALVPLASAAAACAVLLGTAWRDAERELWLGWVAAAVVVCALLGFVEALGLGPQSLPGRAPSGTMGQRNALAHFLLVGSPLVWRVALDASNVQARAAVWAASALIAAVIVQTRSRAAWLTALPVLVLFAVSSRRRAAMAPAVAAVVGVAVAAAAPVMLAWRSPHPYADTLSRLVDSSSGSGAGRLAEWRASLALFAESPLLGLGPGSWFVHYGVSHGGSRFAHSDVVGVLFERGALGAALLAALGACALWRWRGRDLGRVAPVLLAALGVGALDSVVQLPAPLLLVSVVTFVGCRPHAPAAPSRVAAVAFAVVALAAASMTASLWLSTAARTPFDRLELAAKLDPFDGELRFTLAEAWASAGDCERARPHVEALRRLLSEHPKLAALERACGASE